MTRFTEEKAIAEGFLDEMFEAERLGDFQAWSKQWDKEDLCGLNEEIFHNDLKQMNKKLGDYKNREYLGVVESVINENNSDTTSRRLKFVWRVNYKKNEALQVVGLKQINGHWQPYRNSCDL